MSQIIKPHPMNLLYSVAEFLVGSGAALIGVSGSQVAALFLMEFCALSLQKPLSSVAQSTNHSRANMDR